MAMSRIESRRRLIKALQRDAQGINPQVLDTPVLTTKQRKAPNPLRKASRNKPHKA